MYCRYVSLLLIYSINILDIFYFIIKYIITVIQIVILLLVCFSDSIDSKSFHVAPLRLLSLNCTLTKTFWVIGIVIIKPMYYENKYYRIHNLVIYYRYVLMLYNSVAYSVFFLFNSSTHSNI